MSAEPATFLQVAGVALMGAAGAVCRYGLGVALRDAPLPVPASTLLVNLTGSLLLGLMLAVAPAWPALNATWRLALGVGFLGSFTTFSTFGVDTVQLIQAGQGRVALLNIGLHLGLGLAAAAIGIWLGGLVDRG
jgi:fluoride exporter